MRLITFAIEFNDSYLALERVCQLFRRQHFEILYLTCAKRNKLVVRLTISAEVDDQSVRRLELCLFKLVNVASVHVSSERSAEAHDD
jgi:acetolactate synthase small subunit